MSKVAITNVRVFDGNKILEPTAVVIDGAFIGDDASEAQIIDGQGGTLLPGLIDCHIHLHGPETLRKLASWGVTTALDMATWPHSLLSSLRDSKGVTDIRSPGLLALAPGSRGSHMPGLPAEEFVKDPKDAEAFVERRVKENVDYIKVNADLPGLDQETLNAIVVAAKKHRKPTVAHAVQYAAFERALEAKADFLTHTPLDKAFDEPIISHMLAQKTIAIPTLTMMEMVVANRNLPRAAYHTARDSVTALHKAGIPILASTDANSQPGVPAHPEHGESLHHELELMVEAGMSNLDVLRAATVVPAGYFGLGDRGSIGVGKRADVVLVDGNPLEDTKATRNIKRVWCSAVEVKEIQSC